MSKTENVDPDAKGREVAAPPPRTCQWRCQHKNYEECGEPATMFLEDQGLAYCAFHAAAAKLLLPPLQLEALDR